jgi:thioredoxin-dependent peroxiredoxin
VTLAAGDPAPAFALTDQHGTTVRLEEFRGRRVLVYFYPEADTAGCTTQSCDVRDHDVPEAQLAFDRKYSLGFPLLSDPDHAVADAWGTWGEKRFAGTTSMGIVRSSFLVDERGLIERAWYKVRPADTVPQAMAALLEDR